MVGCWSIAYVERVPGERGPLKPLEALGVVGVSRAPPPNSSPSDSAALQGGTGQLPVLVKFHVFDFYINVAITVTDNKDTKTLQICFSHHICTV